MSVNQYLITGGAGFIGSNYVHRLLQQGHQVTILDNLTRAGAERNLRWLKDCHGTKSFRLIIGDVRDSDCMVKTCKDADIIVHLAAQVAVTTSVSQPREDFEINAQGTFNVLEGARASGRNPVFLYASTNKVYGGMDDVQVDEQPERYVYHDLPHGVSEAQSLDFHSPYGCSKGSGDQYVRDYHRMYGLPTIVLRQSCIYGQRQFGIEDQGWVAWFVIAALTKRAITIYGDGKQVRDILFIDDLLDAYDAALANVEHAAGQVFNIGGGKDNTLSVWREFGPLLKKICGHTIQTKQGDWRPGDQRIYVSDIRKAQRVLGWLPKVGVEQGVGKLVDWVKENRNLF